MGHRRTFGFLALTWGGGLLFVASLAYGIWVYMVRLGTGPGESSVAPTVAVAANLILFLLFASHHSLMARSAPKAWVSRIVGQQSERAVYVWVASLLFFGMCAFWQPVAGHAWQLPPPWNWIGRGIQLMGLLVVAHAARTLEILDFAGIRRGPSATTSAPGPAAHEPTPLTTAGPYGWVRHPIYLGTLLLLGGSPDMTVGRFTFLAATAVYLAVAVRWEERSLVGTFGAAYVDYQRQVRWRILPFIY